LTEVERLADRVGIYQKDNYWPRTGIAIAGIRPYTSLYCKTVSLNAIVKNLRKLPL
jgi:hypothetical protein